MSIKVLCPNETFRALIDIKTELLKESYTNLDSRLKSRDITLPTKVPLVKAMFFPVVMYECWTTKKAES